MAGSISSGNDSYRSFIVKEAQKHLGKVSDFPTDVVGGKRKGAAFLKEILDDAFEPQITWTNANLKALETPGTRIRLDGQGGTTVSLEGVHWCGVFAAYVLRRCGMKVKWRSGLGLMPIDAPSKADPATGIVRYRRFVKPEAFGNDIFLPGDVAGIPTFSHHFIVVDISDKKTLGCIAGNGNYQRIEWQPHSRGAINSLYRIVYDPFASRL